MQFNHLQSLCRVVIIISLLALPIAASAQESIHIVQPGDNLYRLSLRYDVSIDALTQANNISNQARILTGQQLTIPDLTNAVETNLFAAEPTRHVIQPGENLASIASKYNLTVGQLAQINNITNPNRIVRGQTLTVFTVPEPVEETAPVEDVAVEPVTLETVDGTPYVVQPGEHLAEIAQRFGVSWPALAKANNIADANWVEAGQTIIIPANADLSDFGIIIPLVEPSPPTILHGRQIVVDLSDSRVYAYEDGQLRYNALASTGLPRTPTVQGNFNIYLRYESQTLSGPGYYLPDVQSVMYFFQGYALHGTYWHNNFGQPMSHGCVNLTNEDALWFFNFASNGTPVLVQA